MQQQMYGSQSRNAAVQPSFRKDTRQQFFGDAQIVASQFGQNITRQLPQTGYLAAINLYCTATIASGAGAAGNFATYPPLPYALFRNVKLRTTEGVVIYDFSGWGSELYRLTNRELRLMATDITSYLNTNNRALLFTTQSGAVAASTNYTFNWVIRIPVYTDDMMMLGLQVLQVPDIRFVLDMTTCNQADTGVTGAATTISYTITPGYEIFSAPPDPNAQPNRQWVTYANEVLYPFSNGSGDVIIHPPIGNIYTSLAAIAENNGAQVPPANITGTRLAFAQSTQFVNDLSYAMHIARFKNDFGFCPPDGYFRHSFDLGYGLPGIADPRDWLNTAQQTDFQAIFSFTGLTPSNAQIRLFQSQLAAIGS